MRVLDDRAARRGTRTDPDDRFLAYLPLIRAASDDDRNEVKKGVNWALRQIGKRNSSLHMAALDEAQAILATGTRSGRWIARDALRELRDPKVIARASARDEVARIRA